MINNSDEVLDTRCCRVLFCNLEVLSRPFNMEIRSSARLGFLFCNLEVFCNFDMKVFDEMGTIFGIFVF